MADKRLDVYVGGGLEDVRGVTAPRVAVVGPVAGTPLATSRTRTVTGISIEDFQSLQAKIALLKEATGAGTS
jgi:hypothetical protein